MNKGDVQKILDMDPTYEELNQMINDCRYLENLSFDVLCKQYQTALLRDNERPLTNFNQYHRDLYMKLKFKAIRFSDIIINPQELREEEKQLHQAPDNAKIHAMIQALDYKIINSQNSN